MPDNGAAKAAAAVVGFDVRLSGASLWDLVQMECQARVQRVFQVVGPTGVGYLYVTAGRLFHAATANLAGEPAALEILSWTNGSFQPCDRSWPPAATIETSYEALILELARRRDEESAGNLVAFPREEWPSDMRGTNIEQPPALPSARPEPGPDFLVTLRLAPNGAVLKNSGGSEEMAEAIAYAHRLLQLAGEFLGLDGLSAMECAFTGGGRCFVFTEGGDIVAVRPRPDANLAPLRERLGL